MSSVPIWALNALTLAVMVIAAFLIAYGLVLTIKTRAWIRSSSIISEISTSFREVGDYTLAGRNIVRRTPIRVRVEVTAQADAHACKRAFLNPLGFHLGGFEFDRKQAALLRDKKAGDAIQLYVNPMSTNQSVIFRQIPNSFWVATFMLGLLSTASFVMSHKEAFNVGSAIYSATVGGWLVMVLLIGRILNR